MVEYLLLEGLNDTDEDLTRVDRLPAGPAGAYQFDPV